jgi:hypothetical protein
VNDYVEVPQELNTILPEDVAISLIRYDDDTIFFDAFSDGLVGGSIMSLSVQYLEGVTFFPPVTIQFEVTAPTTPTTTYTCAYYHFGVKGWVTEGCEIDEDLSSGSIISCKCNHLTNFAVLLDHQGLADSALSDRDKVALEYITLIGLSISTFLLAVTAFFYLWHRV